MNIKYLKYLSVSFFFIFISFISFKGAIADNIDNDIVIGIVESTNTPSLFKEGVNLAIQSLNHTGGTLGKQWRAIFYDDENSIDKGQQIAEKLAATKEVIAVIGHRHPDVALAASIVYKTEKKVFLSPGTDINLYGGTYIFKHGLSDETKADIIADYAVQNEYKKIILLNYFDSYEKRFADIFSEKANDKKIEIVTQKSFSSWDENFWPMISDTVNAGDFNAIFISGRLPLVGHLIRQIREMGIHVPILGSDNLDSSSLSTIAGKSAENTIVSTVFDPSEPSKSTEIFVDDFQTSFGMIPDSWAAMGYDAVKLLADTIEKSQSCDPIVIDNNLRFFNKWDGVISYKISNDGAIIPQSYYFKRFKNGDFEFPKRMIKEDQFDMIRDITLCLPLQTTITTIDPSLAQQKCVQEMLKLLFIGLTGFDQKNNLVPMLAESWSVKDNIYTFYLKKQILWKNNTPVTATDVVETLKRNIQPDVSCPNVSSLYVLKNAKDIHTGKIKDLSKLGAVVKDDFTVEFTLEQPLFAFPELLTLPVFWPLPSKTINEYGNEWTLQEHIQTNGPYKLVYQNNDYLMIFRKNPSFFLEKDVRIPEIRFYIVPDGILGIDQYMNNQLDVLASSLLPIPTGELAMVRSNPMLRTQYTQFTGNAVYFVRFNTQFHPVDDRGIRKAIMASIDKHRLITTITKGNEFPVCSFIPPDKCLDKNACIDFDPDEAQARLAEAGYPYGKNFPVLNIAYDGSDNEKQIAEGLISIISKNLNISAKQTEKNEAHIIVEKKSAQYHISEYVTDLFHLDSSSSYDKQTDISYKNYMALLNQARVENDEKALVLLKQAELIVINNEAVVKPLFVNIDHYLVNPRVREWENNFYGSHNFWQWSLKKGPIR